MNKEQSEFIENVTHYLLANPMVVPVGIVGLEMEQKCYVTFFNADFTTTEVIEMLEGAKPTA